MSWSLFSFGETMKPGFSFLPLVADLLGRRTLHSTSTSRLLVPPVRLSTVGGRAFNVAGLRIWNVLPEEITSAQSLSMFRQRLKTFLFEKSYPDVIL